MKYKVLPEGVSGIIRQLRFSKLLMRAPKLSCSRREYVKPVNKFLHRNDFFLFIRIYKNVTFEIKVIIPLTPSCGLYILHTVVFI